MQNIKDLSFDELKAILKDWGESEFHAKQIFSWLYKRAVPDFGQMTDIPLSLRGKLKENFLISCLTLEKKMQSSDGTEKLLFQLDDSNYIETVIIPEKNRVTGCLSSQAGCKFKCSFCASGRSGFKRNLQKVEILDQALFIKRALPEKDLTHIVFMGTGEPLDNYDNVLSAIRIINSHLGLNIGARRITISTAGFIPGIRRLKGEGIQLELSVSLHAAIDATRSFLMPINKVYPLKDLMKECREYINATNRQITFEYTLIQGINSDLQNAKELSKILRDMNCKVNLIVCNPVEELGFNPPGKLEMLIFKDCLIKSGVRVTLRKARGKDIDAACGQLRLRYESK